MDFNILECRRFIAPCTHSTMKRIVCNYEFDFYIKGGRTIYIDDRTSEITEGCISFRRPGQYVSSKGDYDCYILTVDFSKTTPVANYLRNTAIYVEPEFDNILINSIPDVFTPQHSGELHTLFATIARQPDFNSAASHSLLEEILFLINADLRHKSFSENKPAKTVADDAMLYINRHFNEDIHLSDIANHVCIDKSYLIRMFKKQYSITPVNYLIECRLNHARNLLINTSLSVKEVADMCGYNSTSFFITQFRKNFEITPSEYRQKMAENG